MEPYDALIAYILAEHPSKEVLFRKKTAICKAHGIVAVPTDIQILLHASPEERELLKPIIQTKPTRSISGVAVVAIMTEPKRCPHGRCTMCPGGLGSAFGDVPQSYTGREPATMRAMRADYDPYVQVFNRLEQYIVTGHMPDKIELIVMGGTFPFYEREYRDGFITYAMKAMNDFSEMFFPNGELDIDSFKIFFELPGDVKDKEREKRIFKKMQDLKKSGELVHEQERNMQATLRCIGITIETKPDEGKLEQGNEMLRLGCTRVELGIQSVQESALNAVHRGHTLQDSIESIEQLRDLGFKLNFHMMLGMPTVKQENELKNLKTLFEDSRFRPDMLKLYPLMVMPGTVLEKNWQQKNFTPIMTEESAEILAEFVPYIPEYCRVMRVQRDIPTSQAVAGVDMNNLRQLVDKKVTEKGYEWRDIRAREAGRVTSDEHALIKVTSYDASNGKEFFIAMESGDSLLGFARMRFPHKTLRSEITPDSALIRELHVYGGAVPIGKEGAKEQTQHKGIGQALMRHAETIAQEQGKTKIVVISGIGVREYYRKKLGYSLEGPYMVKSLKEAE